MTDPVARLTGALSDRYRIERELGQGGMATVYLAHDIKHDRKVAIKVLRADLAESIGTARFLREIKVAAKLQHPHVVGLLDSGEADGRPYFAMPYVQGETLRARMAHGRLPIDIAMPIVRALADAIGYAHRHGVVHRDIKPENILLSEGHALVADFGIARAFSDATGEQGATSIGVSVGTPAYMAPEQVAADPTLDHRADIYAWGVVAFEVLTGSPPFTGSSPQQVMAAHITSAPPDINALRPDLSPPLRALIMKCLAKNPGDRPQHAEEIVATLDAVSGMTSGSGAAVTRRAPALRNVAIVAVCAVVVLGGWWFVHQRSGGGQPNANVIAVFPFRVTGDNSAGNFRGEAVVDLLQSDLPGAGKLRVVSAQTAISAWQRAGGNSLTDEQAIAVARGLGAGVLVQGSIVGSGGQLLLNATATDLGKGGTSQTAKASGPADSIVGLIHRIAGQLLSLRAGEDSRRASYLAGVLVPAIRAYLEGEAHLRHSEFDSAYAAFSRALDIDSTFAVAGIGQALANWYGPFSGGRNGGALALRYRNKLSPHDSILLEGLSPKPSGDVVTLREQLLAREHAAVALGDDPEAWFILGDMYVHRGTFSGLPPDSSLERADRAFAMALRFDPGFRPAIDHRFDIVMFLQDTVRLRKLTDSFPDELRTRPIEALGIAQMRNDTVSLNAIFDSLPHQSILTRVWAGMFSALGGHPRDATRAMKLAVATAGTTEERNTARSTARDVSWTIGQPHAATAYNADLYRDLSPEALANNALAVLTATVFGLGDSTAARVASAALAPEVALLGKPNPTAAAVRQSCMLGIWRTTIGDRRGAEEVRQALRFVFAAKPGPNAATPRVMLDARICDVELEAMLADPAAQPALAERLDSLARATASTADVDNDRLSLIEAELWMRLGKPERAERAAQRATFVGLSSEVGLMREAGRAALAAGDTATAINSWSQYLRIRELAEPEARKADDVIRQQLAEITGEHAGRRSP